MHECASPESFGVSTSQAEFRSQDLNSQLNHITWTATKMVFYNKHVYLNFANFFFFRYIYTMIVLHVSIYTIYIHIYWPESAVNQGAVSSTETFPKRHQGLRIRGNTTVIQKLQRDQDEMKHVVCCREGLQLEDGCSSWRTSLSCSPTETPS